LLGNEELLQRLQDRIAEILVRLASQTLQPAMFAATAMAELEAGLSALNSDVNVVKGWVRSLLLGAHPTADDDLPHAIEALAAGKLSRDAFVRQFGQRGSKEMELAEPRWREAPQSLPVSKRDLGGLTPTARQSDADATTELERLISTHKSGQNVTSLAATLADARRYLALREAGKNIFILRYASLRQILLAIGERTRLRSDLFYLTLEELPQSLAGADLRSVIAERKTRRQLELSLSLPSVLFSDDLDAIGRAAEIPSGALVGTPLSLGEFTGPALVLEEPISADDLQPGYVLVCPTTDPAWVPLFLKAGALVMETGGVLSHGAIVAREFGLPAVAGLADIQRQIKTGQRVRVDGNSGTVEVLPQPQE
jgi:pyruvate,water dikinase